GGGSAGRTVLCEENKTRIGSIPTADLIYNPSVPGFEQESWFMNVRFRMAVMAAGWAVFSASLLIPVAYAQVTTATFYGIVTDSSSAAVPGATVALTHEDTATVTRKTTDSAGEFVFDFLRAGV